MQFSLAKLERDKAVISKKKKKKIQEEEVECKKQNKEISEIAY